MAKRAGTVDQYPNRALQSVTQSAANAITYAQMRFGFGTFTGTAIIIHRMDVYIPEATIALMTASTDFVKIAITNRDDMSALDPSNMNVLAYDEYVRLDLGAAANAIFYRMPISMDFSELPGKGLIVPANPLFLGIDTQGLASAAALDITMYYTTKILTDADYVELVQSLIPVNI